ncbi:hypothetical protein BDV33DRAFT_203193 [Aspergillus novoparasiticus]|uniref:Uncharacterized protein n=1 Tax=Aspergillus novoparasiticus TaxID=986946 RepID=A0A5N6ET38_9EURO|nr:hypothetical protein BDV33DRAFT_203193 [Aspergillus novoparasiticus]
MFGINEGGDSTWKFTQDELHAVREKLKGQVQSKYFLENAEDRRTSDVRPIRLYQYMSRSTFKMVYKSLYNSPSTLTLLDLTIRYDTHFDLDFYAYDARDTGDFGMQ